jgi:hypothetical protein
MAFSNHSLDERRPLRSAINRTFSEVVSSDHESSLCAVNLELVKKIRRIAIRSIIKRKRNISVNNTVINPRSTIRHRPNGGSSNASRRSSARNGIRITGRPIQELAIRSRTIINASTAPPFNGAALARRTVSQTRSAHSIGTGLPFLQILLNFLNRCSPLHLQRLRQGILSPQFGEELPPSKHLRNSSMDIPRIRMGACN